MKTHARALTANDRYWVKQLEDWVEQLEGLMALVQGRGVLVGAAAAEPRTQYALFKKDLRAERERLAILQRQGKLTGFGATDYIWAIQQAAAELTLRTTTAPGPRWFSAFEHARCTLSYPLSSLKGGR